jgi:hypothetical protein
MKKENSIIPNTTLEIPRLQKSYSQDIRLNNLKLRTEFEKSVSGILNKFLKPEWKEYIQFNWTSERFNLDRCSFGSNDKFKSVTQGKQFNLSFYEVTKMNSYIENILKELSEMEIKKDTFLNLNKKFKPIFDKYNNKRVHVFVTPENNIQINIGKFEGVETYFFTTEYVCKVKILSDGENGFVISEPEFHKIQINKISTAREFIEKYIPLHDEIIEIAKKLIEEIKMV